MAYSETQDTSSLLLGLDLVEVSEMAAIAAYDWIGCGDEKSADKACVDAMRKALNAINMKGAHRHR